MDWDDVCWNPHESSLRQGIQEGHEAGSLAGFRDGQALGRTKGVEFGMELGFIRGFLTELEQSNLPGKTHRVKNSMALLDKALKDESLHPALIFQRQQHQQDQQSQQLYLTIEDEDAGEEKDDSERNSSKFDVTAKMQRVRARFKVLTVQLGFSNFSLKEMMDQAAMAASMDEFGNDREW